LLLGRILPLKQPEMARLFFVGRGAGRSAYDAQNRAAWLRHASRGGLSGVGRLADADHSASGCGGGGSIAWG
jgi:hypothetical protein